ncbi:Holliday junction resolvase RuvX [Gordonia soli]|uniref:Putative pre-16S rRNA nuclease n=1 Tax=Gordonia soli NBRC 108243 TaxID=1223545 RepID=M0QKK9_9ACTN|nr:Holliday junction resolvase RuvX [Gordonia soli]GAC68811.1 putative Holliday junction resolvase [Gordonia soli NBRC 108243]
MTLDRGRRLGIDVGSVRIGVAVCDPDGILATPVETVARDRRGGTDIERIAALVADYEAVGVIVGLPRTLRNEDGPAVKAARGFGRQLAGEIAPTPIEYVDERLTTVTATAALRASGVSAKSGRAVIDQAAAVAILQGWLDARR